MIEVKLFERTMYAVIALIVGTFGTSVLWLFKKVRTSISEKDARKLISEILKVEIVLIRQEFKNEVILIHDHLNRIEKTLEKVIEPRIKKEAYEN